jgi:hypothetical protein
MRPRIRSITWPALDDILTERIGVGTKARRASATGSGACGGGEVRTRRNGIGATSHGRNDSVVPLRKGYGAKARRWVAATRRSGEGGPVADGGGEGRRETAPPFRYVRAQASRSSDVKSSVSPASVIGWRAAAHAVGGACVSKGLPKSRGNGLCEQKNARKEVGGSRALPASVAERRSRFGDVRWAARDEGTKALPRFRYVDGRAGRRADESAPRFRYGRRRGRGA